MKSATEQLREELFDTLHRLKTGQIDAATAQAVSRRTRRRVDRQDARAQAAGASGSRMRKTDVVGSKNASRYTT